MRRLDERPNCPFAKHLRAGRLGFRSRVHVDPASFLLVATSKLIEPLKIIQHPHPSLRHVSKPLKRVDAELRKMIRQMFDLMYETNGIGLAGNQVDLPYRLFVMNLKGDPAATEEEHVFINPVISKHKGSAESEEGCLSLPGLYCQVIRPEKVTLNAYDLSGNEFRGELKGLFARVVQHEVDHLDGVLFIDRLSPTEQISAKDAILQFESQFEGMRRRGEIPENEAISKRLRELEQLRS